MSPVLERLGLHRPELRAWALYDWANSVFMTSIIQVFPIYFAKVASVGSSPGEISYRIALSTTLAMTVVAILSPPLGALADYAALKKKLLGAFMVIGVTATGLMFFIQRGQWVLACVLYVVGNIGVTGSFVFYDSLLPHVARPEEVDRVSSAGYALGYLGGGLLLAVNLLWMQKPEWFGMDSGLAVRLTFLSAAVWWAVFSIPLFRQVKEPPAQGAPGQSLGTVLRSSFALLFTTLRELRRYRDAFLMLLASVIYLDSVATIIRMAVAYGTEIGIPGNALVRAVLITQFVGIPFSFAFGALAGRVGTKPAIYLSLAVYMVISVVGFRMQTAGDFLVLALLVGAVQGGSQALSRSLFASMVPRDRSSEFFGFYSVFEKFGGILGPALFAGSAGATGSSRPAILGLIVFFVVGGAILAFVNVARGQQAAREANQSTS